MSGTQWPPLNGGVSPGLSLRAASVSGRMSGVQVHLVDGSYELSRHYYGYAAGRGTPSGCAPTRGVVTTVVPPVLIAAEPPTS